MSLLLYCATDSFILSIAIVRLFLLLLGASVVVDGIVAPTQSTMAGWLELLPFKVAFASLLLVP